LFFLLLNSYIKYCTLACRKFIYLFSLNRACQIGQENIVEMLLEAGADGRAHAVTRYSPLYTAVHHGHIKVAKSLLERFPELVQVILQY